MSADLPFNPTQRASSQNFTSAPGGVQGQRIDFRQVRSGSLRPLLVVLLLAAPSPAAAQTVQSSWSATKNASADSVYHDNNRTLYCGCTYKSHNDSDGSGDVDLAQCNMQPLTRHVARASRIEWEHIVPASLMPARQMSCWTNPEQFSSCVSASNNVKTGRNCCQTVSQTARNMIYDLHNLAPSIGQVNIYRLNDRYGVIDDALSPEQWVGCDVQHLRAARLSDHRFEPADCTKGDLARVWFYMHDQHGVVIPDAEWNMFVDWSEADPVSAWELKRDTRIASVQGNSNPYVAGFNADPNGACLWDLTGG